MIEKIQLQFQPVFPVDGSLVNAAMKSGEQNLESAFAYLFNQMIGPQQVEGKMYQQMGSPETGLDQSRPDQIRPNEVRPDAVRPDHVQPDQSLNLDRELTAMGPGNPASRRAPGSSQSASEQVSSKRTSSEQTSSERNNSGRTESAQVMPDRNQSGRGISARTLIERILNTKASHDRLKTSRVLPPEGMKGRIRKLALSSESAQGVKRKVTGYRKDRDAVFDLKKRLSDSIRMGRLLRKVRYSRGIQSSGKTEGNEKEGRPSIEARSSAMRNAGSAREHMSALSEKNAAVRLKILQGSSDHIKRAAKEETGQHGKDAGQGGREVAFVAHRYESNIPKVFFKPDYHIQKNADEIFDQIIKKFSFIVKKGGGEAHVVLEPDLLGRLKMDIRLNQREVHSVVLVDNQSVKDLIISRLNVLEQNLLQHGFSLGSFQVEVNDGGARFSPEGHEQTKRKGDALVEEEASLNPVLQSVPEWISTVINITA